MSLFTGIIERMKDGIELNDDELEQPVSLDASGKVITIGDVIAVKAPLNVQCAFAPRVVTTNKVRPVTELGKEELKGLTTAFLKASDPKKELGIVGVGNYSLPDLIKHVENETAIGDRMIQAVKNYAVFVEEAVRSGKVTRKEKGGHVVLPEFDF